MRIRQQLRLYAAASGVGIVPRRRRPPVEEQVCQLNRSPWDVVDFVFEAHLRELPQQEVEGEQKCEEGDANGRVIPVLDIKHPIAVEKETELIPDKDKSREEKKEEENKEEKSLENGRSVTIQYCPTESSNSKNKDSTLQKAEENSIIKETIWCRRRASKGWKCWREAKEGQAYCEHHLLLNQNRSVLDHVTVDERRRSREQKPLSSSSVTDFYYYSGFGPRWRKRRGTQVAEAPSPATAPVPDAATPSSPATCCPSEDKRSADADEEGIVDCEKKKTKRMRKPMKARSLKTLL